MPKANSSVNGILKNRLLYERRHDREIRRAPEPVIEFVQYLEIIPLQ